jgi:hypothetical protein
MQLCFSRAKLVASRFGGDHADSGRSSIQDVDHGVKRVHADFRSLRRPLWQFANTPYSATLLRNPTPQRYPKIQAERPCLQAWG